ncbi:unnamed protein product, partial [Bubo scandiacus]
ATNRAGISEEDLKYNLTLVLQIQETARARKLALVKVPTLALKELTSVLIMSDSSVIAMSYCIVK